MPETHFISEDECLIKIKEMMDKYKNLKFIIVTFGSNGSILINREIVNKKELNECIKISNMRDSIKNNDSEFPITSKKFFYKNYSIIYCSVLKLKEEEIIDTTGSGDIFCSGIIYGLLNNFNHNKMLELSSLIAGLNTKYLGSSLKEETLTKKFLDSK
jgi:sugar/nucleoside kinase (ribokinase family)